MTRSNLTVLALALCVVSFTAIGCSSDVVEPELGMVTGSVTIDGQPGADLSVTFEPQASGMGSSVGAISTAITDAGGNYELTYKGETKGAVVGNHLIRVISAAGGGPAGGEAGAVQIIIPREYNTDSTLKKDVQKGDNIIDIEIKTK